MKSILLAVFLITGFTLHAQSTLEFNQVLVISGAAQTVPAGKVWKLESYVQSEVTYGNNYNSSSCSSESYQSPFLINGLRYYNMGGVATGSGTLYTVATNAFPIWLPAGSTAGTVCSGDFLSIIEFNVVP